MLPVAIKCLLHDDLHDLTFYVLCDLLLVIAPAHKTLSTKFQFQVCLNVRLMDRLSCVCASTRALGTPPLL